MRLFVAISVPSTVVASVRAFVDELRPLASAKWSALDGLHVTTKFIGEQPPSRIADIERLLSRLTSREPLVMNIQGIGWFPDAQSPKVLWAGVEGPGLSELADATDHALATVGVSIERRAYAPHLTLARIPAGTKLDALHHALTVAGSPEFGRFTADRFTLYESGAVDQTARHRHRAISSFIMSRGL